MRAKKLLVAAAGAILAATTMAVPAFGNEPAPTPDEPLPESSCLQPGGVGNTGGNTNPVDTNVAVYVGGNFTRTAGAELEGQMVVNGNAYFNGSGLYNIGWVGVGSGLLPPAGSDLLLVGGDLVADTPLHISSHDGTNTLDVNISVGGKVIGENNLQNFNVHNTGVLSQDQGRESALGAFSNWADNDFKVLKDFAARNTVGEEGTYTNQWGTLTLTGQPGADRHVFYIPVSEINGGTALSLRYGDNISPTDPVVIVVQGESAGINLNSVQVPGVANLDMGTERFAQAAAQTLWVFPDATSVTLTGGAQLPGSVVVPRSDSKVTMSIPGTNGRFWVAGDLEHNRGGSEFHNFQFIGDSTASCDPELPPAPEVPIEVTPADPQVQQATCPAEGQDQTPPTITTRNTNKITYQVTGELTPGNTITITATTTPGHTFPETLEGWTTNTDKTQATKTFTLTEPNCTPVIDEQPESEKDPVPPVEPNPPDIPEDPEEENTPTDPKQPTGPETPEQPRVPSENQGTPPAEKEKTPSPRNEEGTKDTTSTDKLARTGVSGAGLLAVAAGLLATGGIALATNRKKQM